MNNLYTLFVQKKAADKSPFPLTQQLHDFLILTEAKGIFVCPGYLSYNPTQIETLLDDLLASTKIEKFGIGNKYSSPAANLNNYETHLDSKGILLPVDRNNKADHRKMVFIFTYSDSTNPFTINPKIDKSNYSAILNQIQILGIILGSSNFSFNTYGSMTAYKSKPKAGQSADKGETDLLMFSDKKYLDHLLNSPLINKPNIVLSQNINPIPNDFMAKIFEETLKYTLK